MPFRVPRGSCCKAKRRPCGGALALRCAAAALCGALVILLLFLAPVWLLVLMILLLAGALFLALRRPR